MKHFGLLKNVIYRFKNSDWHFYCPESYPKDERKNKFSKKSFKLTKFKNKKNQGDWVKYESERALDG